MAGRRFPSARAAALEHRGPNAAKPCKSISVWPPRLRIAWYWCDVEIKIQEGNPGRRAFAREDGCVFLNSSEPTSTR